MEQTYVYSPFQFIEGIFHVKILILNNFEYYFI